MKLFWYFLNQISFDKVAPVVVLKLLIVVILVCNKVKLFTPTGKVKYFKISTIFPFYVKSLIIHVYLFQSIQYRIFSLMLTYSVCYWPLRFNPEENLAIYIFHELRFTFWIERYPYTLNYVTSTYGNICWETLVLTWKLMQKCQC